MFVIVDREGTLSGVEGQADLAAFEGGAVVVAQDREQDLTAELLPVCGSPINIEEGGVGRGGSILQHVGPPDVVAPDAHMVRYDI